MTLHFATMLLAAVGLVITAILVAVCWANPAEGLRKLQHEPGEGGHLPEVMLGRYIGFVIMTGACLLLQSVVAVFIVSLGLAFMAWHDVNTYRKSGLPFDRHLGAAIAGTLIVAVSGLALLQGAQT